MPYKDPAKQREAARRHYEANRAEYMRRAVEGKIKSTKDVHDFLLRHLGENPCVDCGESDPVVLEFDHRESEVKRFDIGNFRSKGFGIASVMKEVEKCDVRCANCHRRATYHRAQRKHRG